MFGELDSILICGFIFLSPYSLSVHEHPGVHDDTAGY